MLHLLKASPRTAPHTAPSLLLTSYKLLTTCSKVMMRVGVAFTGGYALGTLIPTALAAVQRVEHQTRTMPGAIVR
eukprot:scaffold55127_cov36-Phaeocystis_antarctica.AAC.1